MAAIIVVIVITVISIIVVVVMSVWQSDPRVALIGGYCSRSLVYALFTVTPLALNVD